MFNGNGYDLEEQAALTAKGCWRLDNGVDAICRMSEAKNVRLFQDMQVSRRTSSVVSIGAPPR